MKKFVYLILSVFSFSQAIAAQTPPEKAKVILQEIKAQTDVERLLLPAKVEAKVSTNVTADIEGHITKVKKPLGASVKAGEVILYIENKDPGFTFASVPVRSPVAGVISQLNLSLMSKVNRGDKLFSVINPDTLKLIAEIPASNLSHLKANTKGFFKIDPKEEGIAIRVNGLSPSIDARTGTAPADFEFVDAKNMKLPAIGTIGVAFFEIKKEQIITIPESALSYFEGKPLVKVLNEAGKIEKRSIELGEQRETNYSVIRGLKEGEKIIVRSNRSLKEGEDVEVESPNKG